MNITKKELLKIINHALPKSGSFYIETKENYTTTYISGQVSKGNLISLELDRTPNI